MSDMVFELSDAELDAVAAAGGRGHGYAHGHKKFDLDVAVVVADQTATATATSGSITISNTHGPLETGKGDLYIVTGDATATAENNATANA